MSAIKPIAIPERVLLYGRDGPLAERIPLRAGPLSMVWEEGDLRTIRCGGVEVLRRAYVAIRDRNWGTVPNVISNLAMEVREDSFDISFEASNRQGEIDFSWRGIVSGTSDGEVRYSMEGVANCTFLKNRIGFCILHPSDAAGATARIAHVDGSREDAVLPRAVGAGQPLLPFAEMAALEHEAAPGLWAALQFEGDIFEMEDQRNWTDASYKTFSTPLRLPYPAQVEMGTAIVQSITLRVEDTRQPAVATAGGETGGIIRFGVIDGVAPLPLPRIGLGLASHDLPLQEVEAARLSALQPSHLRVELHPADEAQTAAQLRRATLDARALGARLEIALFLKGDSAAGLDTLLEQVERAAPPVHSWIVYAEREVFWGGTPIAQVLAEARPLLEALTPGVPIGAGTNYDLIFLSRNLPPLDAVDFLAYAIQPQTHAFDVWSLVETAACQAQTVATAAAHGKPVHISPVTLKMRRNPYATASAPPTPAGELPSQVDLRQMSLFGAGWTLRSIKHLAESGAASITFYETTGWRGVMETVEGSPVPAKFVSAPGDVFPLYHVLADLADFAGNNSQVAPSVSSDPLAIDGLVLRQGAQQAILLANGTPYTQTVSVAGVTGAVRLRLLDTGSALEAIQRPEHFRTGGHELLASGRLDLRLPPYGVARLDHLPG